MYTTEDLILTCLMEPISIIHTEPVNVHKHLWESPAQRSYHVFLSATNKPSSLAVLSQLYTPCEVSYVAMSFYPLVIITFTRWLQECCLLVRKTLLEVRRDGLQQSRRAWSQGWDCHCFRESKPASVCPDERWKLAWLRQTHEWDEETA